MNRTNQDGGVAISAAVVRVLASGALALQLVVWTGCGKPEAVDEHASHGHGSQAVPAPVAATGETCALHKVAKSRCFICDPALRDKKRLWCAEHGRYEDRCWMCHPDLQDKKRLYCDEHGLYEDECFICHPEVTPAPRADSPTGGVMLCREHGVPEAQCGICRPDGLATMKPGESLKVRLPSDSSAKLVGIETAQPGTGDIRDGIACYAELSFNQNKLARVAAPVGGIVRDVTADLGDTVGEGATVVRIWSAEIAEAMAKAVLTHQTLERERKLRAEGITAGKDLEQAEAEHRAACQQARTFGFSEEDIERFGKRPDEAILLEVRVPFAGEIIARDAVRGELIEAGHPLFTVVDRSVMWAMLSLPETALGRVAVGQPVEVEVDALPGVVFGGKLTWISAEVDETTRMARARAEIPNPGGHLRARMFAQARVLTSAGGQTLHVPAAAVQRVGEQPLVFIKQAADLFEARVVRVGPEQNGMVEVREGLQSGEEVVVAQAFAVKSQLLLSRLGAGCADE
jgi:cobalt-zinc-cadmium efflux system membrane fusion protein